VLENIHQARAVGASYLVGPVIITPPTGKERYYLPLNGT
jgi:hypothetical protein